MRTKKTNKKTKHEEQTKDIFTSSLSAFRLIDSVGVNLKLPTRTGTRWRVRSHHSLWTSLGPTWADAVGAVWGEPAAAPLLGTRRCRCRRRHAGRRRWGGCRDPAAGPALTGETMLLLLLLLRRLVMLLAAAGSDAGLVELLQTLLLLVVLVVLVVVVRLEMMRLLRVEGEVMPVSKQRQLDHSGPVKARLARRALALEGLQAAVRTPLLSAHLRGARPFIRGLHLSLHPRPGVTARRAGGCVAPGRYCGGGAGVTGSWRLEGGSDPSLSGSVSLIHTDEGWANLLTSRRSNPQSGAPTLSLFQRGIQAGLVRRCLPPL